MENIRVFRKKSGLTQEKFADIIGVPVSTYRNWEYGISPTPAWLEKFEPFLLDLIKKAKNGN